MPKLDKPRADGSADPEAARAFLAAWDIDPAEVTRAVHFSDGSLSIATERWHLGIESDPALATEVALGLCALGVPVERDPQRPTGDGSGGGT